MKSYTVQKTAGFGGITSVQIRGAGAAWTAMNNKFGSAWEVSTTPALPWDFQFTSDGGQTVSSFTPKSLPSVYALQSTVLRDTSMLE